MHSRCRSADARGCVWTAHIGRATHFVVSGWQEMSKGGQKLQSGRLTHLVDQQICWYGWCWLAVPFVVSVPFDDKICWYGQAFRINILCNRPILLMEQICATVVVQFLQCSLHCAMWPVYICKWLLGQYYCIVCLFVCCVSYVYCLSLEQLLCPWDEWKVFWKVSSNYVQEGCEISLITFVHCIASVRTYLVTQ